MVGDGPRTLVCALAVLALVTGGCTLRAREHACYPFVVHQFQGAVPSTVARSLAAEHGTRRAVGRYRAPRGYYWRKHGPTTLDVTEVRTVVGDYELARCPSTPAPALPSSR